MSWDVMVFNYAGKPPAPAAMDDVPPLPLGAAASVRANISRCLPGVDWSEPGWGIFEADEISVEFNIGDADPVDSLMLHVRGTGNPLPALLSIATGNSWSLLDCTTGQFIDPARPSSDGWREFQAFRDTVAARYLEGPLESAKPSLFERILLHWNMVLPGTNLLGLNLTFGVFLVMILLKEPANAMEDALLMLAGGALVLALDMAYRWALFGGGGGVSHFLQYWRAGRLLFIPVWVFASLWIVQGAIKAIIAR